MRTSCQIGPYHFQAGSGQWAINKPDAISQYRFYSLNETGEAYYSVLEAQQNPGALTSIFTF